MPTNKIPANQLKGTGLRPTENHINKESKSLNKFAADLDKFMEKYIKKDKDKISTKLEKNEIKDAIQKGFNDYFDS